MFGKLLEAVRQAVAPAVVEGLGDLPLGLAEKASAALFQKTVFPRLRGELQRAIGFELPIEVDWGSLTVDGIASELEAAWTAVYFTPLREALVDVGQDELGREAARAGLKRVVIRNSRENESARGWATLKDGVLTLDHHPLNGREHTRGRTQALREALDAGL